MTSGALRGIDMEANLKNDEREGNALDQMSGSVGVEGQKQYIPDAYNYRDNRIHCGVLAKGTAQERHERGDNTGSIQSATLDECEYD